jgi:hypothetical protein
MIKRILLLLVCVFITVSASAQWWKKAQPQHRPLLQQTNIAGISIKTANPFTPARLTAAINFERSAYSFDAEEAYIMKGLYHSLRFRQTPEILDGFNRLIALYILESRYSEAKWYILQCNYIGHKNKDNDVIVSSLIALGMLKADIGEYDQAKQDLLEAQDICLNLGRAADATDIDKKLKVVEIKRFTNVKNDVRYAEVAENKKG